MANETVTIVSKRSWKQLKIDKSLADEPFLDGFLGIEELTDYEIVKSVQSKSVNRVPLGDVAPRVENSKSIKKKRPIETENEGTTGTPPTKRSKIKDSSDAKEPNSVKRRRRNLQKPKNSYDKDVISASTTLDPSELEAKLEATVNGWLNLFVPEPILKALAELGFSNPTSIQSMTLPAAIRDRRDIVGAAETGSGKTLAFGIPIIHHILCDKEEEMLNAKSQSDESGNFKISRHNSQLRGLIVTPTRELAVQIKDHLVAIAKYTNIKFAVLVGGLSLEKQYRVLKRKPDIVIGTPGRLCELIQEGEPHLSKVSSVKYLVIDEADRLLEKGHFEDLDKILERIKSDQSSITRQTFVFSATLTLIHPLPWRVLQKKKKIRKMDKNTKLEGLLSAIGVREKPKIVDITRKLGTAETLTEARINCSLEEKDYYLYYFFTQHPGRTLVFCNSIDCIRRLQNIFTILKTNPWPLHATMHQKQRLKNLERFTANETGILLATDVAARGLDIPNVEHVIHYQVPRTSEAYIHRSGRTARATKEGLSVMLIASSEVSYYHRICNTLNRDKELAIFPVQPSILKEVKARVNLARELDQLEHGARKSQSQKNWYQRTAEDMDMEFDKDQGFNDGEEQHKQALNRKRIKYLHNQLNILLKTPMQPKVLAKRFPTFGINLDTLLSQYSTPETALALMKKETHIQDKLLKDFYARSKKLKNKKRNKRK